MSAPDAVPDVAPKVTPDAAPLPTAAVAAVMLVPWAEALISTKADTSANTREAPLRMSFLENIETPIV
jgi:hypothetical protein